MSEQTKERIEVETKSEKRARVTDGVAAASVERRQEYENVDAFGSVREERVVKDAGAERVGLAQKLGQLIWLLGGLLEAALGTRFLLKLIAANPDSPFARFVYEFTDLFLWPFQALTATPSAQGMVLEIPTLFGMLVYGLLTWAVVKLVYLALVPSTSERVTFYRREES